MAVNLDSVFYCHERRPCPSMKKQGRGWIINVARRPAVRGEAIHSHYAATKGALHALTKSLGRRIRALQHPGQLRGPGVGGHGHVH